MSISRPYNDKMRQFNIVLACLEPCNRFKGLSKNYFLSKFKKYVSDMVHFLMTILVPGRFSHSISVTVNIVISFLISISLAFLQNFLDF